MMHKLPQRAYENIPVPLTTWLLHAQVPLLDYRGMSNFSWLKLWIGAIGREVGGDNGAANIYTCMWDIGHRGNPSSLKCGNSNCPAGRFLLGLHWTGRICEYI